MPKATIQFKKLLPGILILASLSGCSLLSESLFSKSEETTAPRAHSTDGSFTVYLQKGGLGGAEFEQYKLLPIGVFVECGKVVKGRFNAEYQKIIAVDPDTLNALRSHVALYIQSHGMLSKADVDEPGSGSGFTDSGRCEVMLSSSEDSVVLETSVNWVERARSKASRELRALIEEIRDVPEKVLCGNQSFYGLNRK